MKFDIALVGMKNQLSRVKGPACEEDILVGARGESVKRADGKTVRLVNVIRSTKAVPCPR